MLRLSAVLALMVALIASAGFASAQERANGKCVRVTAPQPFQMKKARENVSGSPVNAGIIPNGFVDLPGRNVVHGIDVSKYQEDADFKSVADCGGKFAYVRLSAGTAGDNELLYRTQWANARAAGLLPGPYHNLSILPKAAATFAGLRQQDLDAKVQQLLPVAGESGRHQAKPFLARLDEVLSLDPRGSATYLPMALDLSATPLPTAKAEQRIAFSKLYKAVACGFMQEIRRSKHGTEPAIVFIEAANYAFYGIADAGCGLETLRVWLRFRPTDGSSADRQVSAEQYVALCGEPRAGGTERCVMEQYTSFGGFAIFRPGAPLDLDRFYDETTFDSLIQHGG